MTIRTVTPRAPLRSFSGRLAAAAAAVLVPTGRAAGAGEWQPPRGHEPTLGDLIASLASGQGGALLAPLLLAALLLALLVGLQALSSRS